MQLDVESQLLDGFKVGQVPDLLQKQGAENGVELLCAAAGGFGEKAAELLYRQLAEKLVTEQPGPRLVQELSALFAEKAPLVEQGGLVVALDVDHRLFPNMLIILGIA